MNKDKKTYRSLQSDLNSLLLDMRMDSSYTLEEAVDVLLAMARAYEKHSTDYKRRVKLNERFNDV
jgi:hypothetical protein